MRAEFVRRLDAQRAGDRARHRQRLAVGVVQRREQRTHLAIDRLAGIGQPQMPRGPLDQPQPEIGLEPLHRSTKARLGVTEHARSRTEAAMLDNFAKQLPVTPLHGRLSIHRYSVSSQIGLSRRPQSPNLVASNIASGG